MPLSHAPRAQVLLILPLSVCPLISHLCTVHPGSFHLLPLCPWTPHSLPLAPLPSFLVIGAGVSLTVAKRRWEKAEHQLLGFSSSEVFGSKKEENLKLQNFPEMGVGEAAKECVLLAISSWLQRSHPTVLGAVQTCSKRQSYRQRMRGMEKVN